MSRFWKLFCLSSLLAGGLFLSVPVFSQQEGDTAYEQAVEAYRKGEYSKVLKLFEDLHRKQPENLAVTYYLAISNAQLRRVDEARRLYEEIVALDPMGQTGVLAREGLKYLPANQKNRLDLPPKVQATESSGVSGTNTPNLGGSGFDASGYTAPDAPQAPQAPQAPESPQNQQSEDQTFGGMSPQEWMMIQSMMQSGGANNGGMGGMGMMMPFMMQGQQGGQGNIDPNAFSTLMMNQMLQNMDFSGGNSDNDR